MDIQKYLDRINYEPNHQNSVLDLKILQKNHLINIPFENLDIHYGIPIKLNFDSLYKKIILNKRGGFCYELNGLFYELLISMGYNAKRISGRVFSADGSYGKEFDHLAILIMIGKEEYLTDVGFGEFAFSPLKLELINKQFDERGVFFFDEYDDKYLRVNKIENGKPVPQYIFTTEERDLSEFEGMCHYHQTHPDSHFTQKKTISIPVENGRVTLTNDKLKITEAGNIKETPVSTKQEFDALLLKYFGIKL